jgi:AcrR family transcriptional regulator
MTEAARRRAMILEVADKLLRHYGPHKTTVADVAREAGVGVGTVYLEFPSKDSIVEELARSRHHKILEAMRAAAAAPRKTYKERLSGAFDARLDAYLAIADEGAHACDLVHCSGKSADPTAQAGVRAALLAYHDEERALVADLLRRGAAAGELDVKDPDATARAVLRAYASFGPPWVATRDRAEVRASIAVMHDLVLHGVVRRGARKAKR